MNAAIYTPGLSGDAGYRRPMRRLVTTLIAGLDRWIGAEWTAASLANLETHQLRDIGASAELDRRGRQFPVDARTMTRLMALR